MSKPKLGKEKTMTNKAPTMDTVLNLSRYHREHEKFYAQAPLEKARDLQQASIVLKTLADRWSRVTAGEPMNGNPYAGCEDLNEAATIQHTGVLFMEGEAEPPEVTRLKHELRSLSEEFSEGRESGSPGRCDHPGRPEDHSCRFRTWQAFWANAIAL